MENQILKKSNKKLYVYLIVIMIAGSFNFLNDQFRLGESDLFTGYFLFLTFYFLHKNKDFLAAVAFMTAIVKVIPWVFIPLFLVNKKWKFLGYGVLLTLITYVFLFFWFKPNFILIIRHGYQDILLVRFSLSTITSLSEQSLNSVLTRLLIGVMPQKEISLILMAILFFTLFYALRITRAYYNSGWLTLQALSIYRQMLCMDKIYHQAAS